MRLRTTRLGVTSAGRFALPLDQQIAALFASNEQGVWYDIDPAYCYQDAAGVVPAVVGQPVGLVLDRSKGLELGPELVTNGGFDVDVSGWTVVAGFDLSWEAGAARVSNATPSFGGIISNNFTTTPGRTYQISVDLLSQTGNTMVLVAQTSAGVNILSAPNLVPGNHQLIFVASTSLSRVLLGNTNAATSSRLIDNISVRELPGNHASQTTATSRPILRQNATTGAHYLEFDGSDDFLVTNSIDFTATDKMTVWAGVRKLSDAAAGVLAELSNSFANAGAFALLAPPSAADRYAFGSTGTLSALASSAGFAAPTADVLVGIGNISGSRVFLRVDGVQVAISGATQGTGNYGNYPLYIGRRGGTSIPFNGHLYGLIVRGAQSTEAQIKLVERYLAKKTGVTLA